MKLKLFIAKLSYFGYFLFCTFLKPFLKPKSFNKAMRYLAVLLLCSMILLMTNCATSGPLASALMKQGYSETFNTSVVSSNFEFNSGGLGSSSAIQYQVQVYCKNNCNSAKAVLSFYVSSGGNSVYIHNHNLNIYAGNKSYHWNQNSPHKLLDSAMVELRLLF